MTMAQELTESVVEGGRNLASIEIVLCPPSVYLPLVSALTSSAENVFAGAQDASEYSSGAYTGEVSCAMLRDIGCRYVIVGHSERRQYHHESDEVIAAKVNAVLAENMMPIACIGETLEERQSGCTQNVVEKQLRAIIAAAGNDRLEHLTIAYEPIWAIGTGRVATPQQAQEVHNWIRSSIASVSSKSADVCRILYGGSVKGDNASSVLNQQNVDGCLVGGASLKSPDFLQICHAAI